MVGCNGNTESHGTTMKRFACGSIIPDCDRVFTGLGDQSVLDQALEHAAANHGMAAAPLPYIELVLTYTRPFTPTSNRGQLRSVDHDKGMAALANVRRLHRPEWGRPQPSESHHNYRHECLLYAGTTGFLDAVVPFVRDGLALREPLLIMASQPRLAALKTALAGDAGKVMFADMAELGNNPASIIPSWREFIDLQGGVGRPVRGISELIWATRPPEVVAEAQMHEALLNAAVPPDTPLWLLCPYDTEALDEPTIVEATRSHPVLLESNTYRGSTRYGGAAHGGRLSGTKLPKPGVPVRTVIVDPAHHSHVSEILTIAANQGVRIDRAVKLAAAVEEIAAAVDRDNFDVRIRVWSERAALVCEVLDPDTVHDPPARWRTGDFSARDRAVRLANEMCDLVQVRSGPAGTATRLRCWM